MFEICCSPKTQASHRASPPPASAWLSDPQAGLCLPRWHFAQLWDVGSLGQKQKQTKTELEGEVALWEGLGEELKCSGAEGGAGGSGGEPMKLPSLSAGAMRLGKEQPREPDVQTASPCLPQVWAVKLLQACS